MAVNIEVVAEKVFNLLAGNGYDISNLNSKGEKVIDPQEATRFVVVKPNILVRLDPSTETLSMGVRETFDDDDLRDAFKHLAGDYLMNFDYRIFGKTLKPKSETIDIAKKSEKKMGDILEATNELRELSGLEPIEMLSEAEFWYVQDELFPLLENDATLAGPFTVASKMGQNIKNLKNKFLGKFGHKDSGRRSISGQVLRKAQDIGNRMFDQFIQWKARNYPGQSIEDQTGEEILQYIEKELGMEKFKQWPGSAKILPYLQNFKNKYLPRGGEKTVFSRLALAYHQDEIGDAGIQHLNKEAVEEVEDLKEFRRLDKQQYEDSYEFLNLLVRRLGPQKLFTPQGKVYMVDRLYNSHVGIKLRDDAEQIVSDFMYVSKVGKSPYDESIETEDYERRPSLDTDLPPDYFDKLALVKKTIFSKYGNNDRVNMIIRRLNDDEKANGRKADPNNILMKVSAHLGESVDWEKIDEGFSAMSGSTKTSYQGLDNVKLVIRHKKEVNEEVRGARSRNISSIFVQRGDERFKMAENNLKAARAMARHVKNGGEPFDTVGNAINEMAVEQRKLREFVRYVKKSGLVNEENETYVNLAMENINYITSAFTKLAGVKSYANAVEDVTDRRNTEVLEDDLDLESKFTETHFDDRVASVVDTIKSAMSRKTAFESYIDKAVSNESFTTLKNMLSEDDGMEFATPHAKLGYQVGQLSSSVTDSRLGNYLSGISKKLYSGDRMSQHEYTTVKSCLLGAHKTTPVSTSVAESVEDQYEKFIEQFDIL